MSPLAFFRGTFVACLMCFWLAMGAQISIAAKENLAFVKPPPLKSVGVAELRQLVLAGKQVTGRLVRYRDVVYVLEHADHLLSESPKACLRLKASRVTEGTIRLTKPFRPLKEFSPEVQQYLGNRKLTKALYIPFPIEIQDTTIAGKLYLNDVVFEKEVSFQNVDFRDSVYFQGAAFSESATFNGAVFRQVSDFSASAVFKTLSLQDPQFTFVGNFSGTFIPSNSFLFITGERVEAPLDFSQSTIQGRISLQGIGRTLEIADTVYLTRVNKDGQNLQGHLSFKDVEFHKNLYLDQGSWKELDIAESKNGMHRPIRFLGFCDLRQAKFDLVNLEGAEFERGADFSGTEIVSALVFDRTTFREPIRITWPQIKGKLRGAEAAESSGGAKKGILTRQSYAELERNFRQLNDLKGENECRFEERLNHEGKTWEYWISGFWVRPWITLRNYGIVFLISMFVNWVGFRRQWFHQDPAQYGQTFIRQAFRLTYLVNLLKARVPQGYTSSVSGKIAYFCEYMFAKGLQGVLLISISNTSPLLKQLLPYLLP